MTSGNQPGSHSSRRTFLGVLAGGGLFLSIMLLLAGVAVGIGWLGQNEAGPLELRPWLILEIIGGAGASVLGGAVSRRIARHYRGPAVLALVVFGLGVLEATEVLRYVRSGNAVAPQWLVLMAPLVATSGVLIGGRFSTKGSSEKATQQAAALDHEG